MELIGRRTERARIDRLLDDARSGGSGTLVLRGEPGIGKSTLLAYALERAADMATLHGRGVESEADLPFAALQALLSARIEVLELIPEPQARALRAALALSPAGEGDRLAANAGTLSMLAEVAEERPLLVAVDDAQWLDRASGEALLFAARRAVGEAIAFLFVVGGDRQAGFRTENLADLLITGLDRASALALVRARSPQIAPAVARLLITQTRGNPLALVELPALLSEAQLTGHEPVELPLPIGRELGRAFLIRVRRLATETQRALIVAAAGEGAGMKAVVDAAAALGCGERPLDAAEAAGLVDLADGKLTFRHPLVRSAVYQAAPPAERRAAHRRLAAVLDGDQRAWQLAAAAEGVDEEAAVALEQAAERAAARCSDALQWRAYQQAVRLSPEGDGRTRRMLGAARAATHAGELERALELVERALPLTADPLLRADLRHQQAVIVRGQGARFSEDTVLEAADTVAPLDAERAAKLLGLVLEKRVSALQTSPAVRLAEHRAAMCASASREWRLRTRGDLMSARVISGDAPGALVLLDDVLADGDRAAEQAVCLIWLERYADARRTLVITLERARTSGRPLDIAWSQACTAMLELRAGRLVRAQAAASESTLLAAEIGAEKLVALNLPTLGRIAAIQGRAASCREHAALADRLGTKLEDEQVRSGGRMALGLLALGLGDPRQAVAELEPVACLSETNAVREPSVLPFAADLIEAFARLGEPEAAGTLLGTFAARAQAVQRAWALAAAARCAGILANEPEVDLRFQEALELGRRAGSPFEEARTELCFGERLRRLNRRREARPLLKAALRYFDEVGADPWARRARAELRATGQTVPRRDRHAPEKLTPQELQISLLVAEGKSNRDVAGAMFLSRKTVEYHLGRIYPKLNVHSRSELTRLFAASVAPSGGAATVSPAAS